MGSGASSGLPTRGGGTQLRGVHAWVRRLIDASEACGGSGGGWGGRGAAEKKSAELRAEHRTVDGGAGGGRGGAGPRTKLIRVTGRFTAYEVMLGVLDGVEVYGHLLIPRERLKAPAGDGLPTRVGGQRRILRGWARSRTGRTRVLARGWPR